MGAPSDPPASLTATRLLPRHARANRLRDRTRFLIEDLNGAFFTLSSPGSRRQRGAAVERTRRALLGTAWMTGVVDDAWDYAQNSVEEPTDAFGAAAILLSVAGDDARVRAWVETLGAPVRRALRLVLGPSGSRRTDADTNSAPQPQDHRPPSPNSDGLTPSVESGRRPDP